ncbi:M10 family metallopeptidase C-terminal domain-containing protein [Aestuariivirga sp.]|uniref:M10 family metallopeptidase C-terminal domain-containing protein n=1 Tax=Aestuariivirga sp. TaxID=2650926 RepID=UPI003593352E
MTVDIISNSMQVLSGAFLARAVYGGEYISPAFDIDGDDDAEKADDYRGYLASQGFELLDNTDLPTFNGQNGDAKFTTGGLYNAKVTTLTTNSFDAQGLLAISGGDTLVLSFRGTDAKDPAFGSGQAYTGQGLAANYKAFKPLINAAHDYLADHPEITDVVVSGHSLGGALADVFTLVDADRFRELRPDHLTIVSLGSSGIPPDLPEYLSGIDAGTATIVKNTIEILPGIEFTTKEIKAIFRPDDYISISNAEDRVHFPKRFPDVPEDPGLLPIQALRDNLQFGGNLLFDMPNIDNVDVEYGATVAFPFEYRGFGAEHNVALLWANLQGLVNDDLFSFYKGQKLTAGITDYNAVPDFNGTPIALFEGYIELANPTIMNDSGSRALTGSSVNDYILGLDGNDRIEGRAGTDLLSGGKGNDTLLGGAGVDLVSGGEGQDTLSGGGGRDRFYYSDIAHSAAGSGDVIRDFSLADDRIGLKEIDADPVAAGDQAFIFIGTSGFTDIGQIRAIQSGTDTLLRINVTSDPGVEMEILLKNVSASALTELNFIL